MINALRMRPDRIIVGEVRREEALDMLQAMNTGHDGSLTTIHANTPRDGLGRLEVMVGMANANMGIRSIRQQIASRGRSVRAGVALQRRHAPRHAHHRSGRHGGDMITLQDIFLFEKTGITENGKVTGRFRATGIRPKFYERLKACGITLPHADVPDGGGDQLDADRCRRCRFVVVFALILLAVSVGLKFFDARRKKQVVGHAADRRRRAGGHRQQPAEGNRAEQADRAQATARRRCSSPSTRRSRSSRRA